MNITIDGPSGSGKSTAARGVAARLNIAYLDTGAMYRAIGFYAIKHGVSPDDEAGVISLLPDVQMRIESENGHQKVLINAENVTPYLRTHDISWAASTVSKIPEVRIKLVELQREIAKKTDCVMDGRDTGSHVLPNAEFKFYLTADDDTRAERRLAELTAKGHAHTLEEIKADIIKRDTQDSTRKFAPLVVPEGAVTIDTSKLGVEEVVDKIISIVRSRP